MNGTWIIANRILLLRVSQTLIPQVRLSAFGGPHDAPCRRFHVPSTDHIENAFRHDVPCRRLVTYIALARHTAAPAALGRCSFVLVPFPSLSLFPSPFSSSPSLVFSFRPSGDASSRAARRFGGLGVSHVQSDDFTALGLQSCPTPTSV